MSSIGENVSILNAFFVWSFTIFCHTREEFFEFLWTGP